MTVPRGSEEVLWEFLGNLWDRFTGGKDVAARPDKAVDDVWPSATRPPGVAAALSWLESNSETGTPRVLLLVGGPGAGKSHATATAVRKMTKVSIGDKGLASRAYLYESDHRKLLVVNDATISDGNESAPLVLDINDSLGAEADNSTPTDILACVNRGILIEEAGHLSESNETPGALLVSWLAEDVTSRGALGLFNDVYLTFGRSAELRHLNKPLAHVVVIFVDECSLFEGSPEIEIVDNSIVETSPYIIRRFSERAALSSEAQKVPAADLLHAVLAKIREQTAFAKQSQGMWIDPLAANLKSLESSSIQASILTLARAAELATSTRMTYRELWGFIARAIVGCAPEQLARGELAAFIRDNQPEGTSISRFEALRRLSALRFTQGIFGAGTEAVASARVTNDPVLRFTVAIDPIADALPGNDPTNPRAGWADPVHEAFSMQSEQISPLSALLGGCVERVEDQRVFETLSETVNEFDWEVDNAFSKVWIDDAIPDSERLAAASWYGAYLTRLYAVGLGICGFRREIDALIEAIVSAPRLPDVLRKPMETLLRPKRDLRDGDSEALLPLFDSRTEPVVGHLIEPKVAIRVEDGRLITYRGDSDQVFLEIKHEGEVHGRINIDFALVREALACIDDHAGVTNLVDVTAPRLERVRSSRLRSKLITGAEVRIATAVESHLLTLRDN